MASLCECAAPGRWSACRCWVWSVSSPTGTNTCSLWSCAAGSRLRRGKAASTISWRGSCELRCYIIDGNPGLRRAVGGTWPRAAVQRCCVHKLRNLERKAPKHVLAEICDDFHRVVYAANADAARAAYAAFERTWAKRCPGVVTSLREGGNELFTFFTFPKVQWKTLRSTNAIERLHGEFRRRVKTQGSLPSEDAALILLFSLVASGQIKLRRIDGWRKIATVLSQHTSVAA